MNSPGSGRFANVRRGIGLCLLAALLLSVAGGVPAGWAPGAFGQPSSPGAGDDRLDIRTIPVTVITDSSFRALPQWRGKARRIVDEATDDLIDVAGLHFPVTEMTEWDPDPRDTTLLDIMESMPPSVLPAEHLVVLLLGRRSLADETYLGYAELGRPYVVVGYADNRTMQMTLRHELGHTFGLPHLPGRSVMAERREQRTWGFDAMSRDVLRATRDIDFWSSTPFSDCNLEILRDAYLAWLDGGYGHPMLWLYLGMANRREGHPRDALLCLQAALRMDKELAEAWYHMGRANLELRYEVDAIQALERYLELDPHGRFSGKTRSLLETLR